MSYTTENDLSYDPSLHDSQMVAVYETMAEAEAARASLVSAGIAASDVEVIAGEGPVDTTTRTSENEGFWGAVKNLFAPDDDYHTYHHALGHGHAMVVVTLTGPADREHILEVLESSNPIDIDAKREEWSGSTSHTSGTATGGGALAGAAAGAAMASTPAMGTTTTSATERTTPALDLTGERATGATSVGGGMNDTIKVVQERLRVGKREVAKGAVRVRSYVVERPVEEQVRLHEETVSIERRPVDRPVTGTEAGLFQERTLEARSTAEEAVVQKEARVVEEIGLNKQASDRTETVRDTVRETKVEIDDQTAKVTPGATHTETTRTTGTTSIPGGSATPRK